VNDAADADEDLDVAVVEEEVQKPDNNVEDLESNEAD
jgi:hypothetical protein